MAQTATKKELEQRVVSLEKDMRDMNEMVSRLMMHKVVTEVMSEIRVWMNQGDSINPTAVEWITSPTALQKAVQETMVAANEKFQNRTNTLNIWEELKGFMMGRLFLQLEKPVEPEAALPEKAPDFTTH